MALNHIAIGFKNWIAAIKVQALSCPAKTSGFNIMGNMWAMLFRLIYASGKQFESLIELRKASNNSRGGFFLTEIQTLYDSLPNRIFEVIKSNGKSIFY